MRHLRLVLLSVIACVLALSSLPALAQTYPAWAVGVAYSVGQQVTYQDANNPEHLYKCQQAHTSEVGWQPPAVPALWIDEGPYGGGGATATTAPTNTPVPPTKTNTPAPATNTPVPATKTPTVQPPTNTPVVTNTPAPATKTPTVQPPTNTPVATSTTASATKTNTPAPSPTSSGSGSLRIMGYYADWDVYARGFYPKGMLTNGTLSKINYLIFAFGNITNNACVMGDTYADSQMNYPAVNAVSGVADPTDGSITTGIIHQLQEIKALYPNLKIIWSFGGWTWSSGFGAASANAAAFASSCYNLVHDPHWNGLFSGIDIDWEYPNACGNSCDTSGYSSYPTLMAALRSKFGSDLVTAAMTADGTTNGIMDKADYGTASQYLDWYNVMTYDYFGAWASTGPTAPHSPLYSYTGIPTAGFYSDQAIQHLKSKGVPASKIQLGIGFYGRGWTGVTQAAPGGSATGAANGTYQAGIEDYHVLVNSCPSNGTVAGTAYAFCGNNWWSYDTPSTIAGKMSYAKSQGLGGAFFWEAFGDTTSGDLISAMYNNR